MIPDTPRPGNRAALHQGDTLPHVRREPGLAFRAEAWSAFVENLGTG